MVVSFWSRLSLVRERMIPMAVYIGLDIGGTKLLAGAADRAGHILRRARRDTPVELEDGLRTLVEMTELVSDGEEVIAIGASVGGPLDAETGVVSPLHQPDWRGVPLKSYFQRRFGRPFFVDVDTNAAVLAERAFGGCDADPLIYVTLSTGVGGGILLGGEIYRGAGGEHPEIGHMAIPFRCRKPERVVCECGAQGCFEALCSGNGIERIYGKPAESLSGAEWREVAWNAGQALRNIAAMYAPERIVLGGGVAVGGGETFLREAVQVMSDNLKLVSPPEVALSALGYDTALYGALALARDL